MSGTKKRAGSSRSLPLAESPEVEEMLRAAEDELLMELHVGSHTISSSSLDSDLARRFQALKSPRLPPHPKTSHPIPPPPSSTSESTGFETRDQIQGDDLMARFAALKGPTHHPQPMTNPISNRVDSSADEEIGDGDEVSKKEVERVMQWAIDAARLDPSRSDDEDNNYMVKENNGLEESESDSESEVEEKRRKVKDKGKSSKWFSFFR